MTTRPESFNSSSAAAYGGDDARDGIKRPFLANFYIDDYLGKNLQVGGQRVERLSSFGQRDRARRERSECHRLSWPGGERRNVARLFAAESCMCAFASLRGHSGRRRRAHIRMPLRLSAASRPMFDMVVATTRSPVNRLRALRSRAAMSRMASPLMTLPGAGQHAAVGVAVEGYA